MIIYCSNVLKLALCFYQEKQSKSVSFDRIYTVVLPYFIKGEQISITIPSFPDISAILTEIEDQNGAIVHRFLRIVDKTFFSRMADAESIEEGL